MQLSAATKNIEHLMYSSVHAPHTKFLIRR